MVLPTSPGTPVIRRGKSGHFNNKALEGVAHHAVVPNVNVLDDLEPRLERLSDDEKRLFALICRSYLAAVMPDYEYRQTVATINVPVPGGPTAEFRAILGASRCAWLEDRLWPGTAGARWGRANPSNIAIFDRRRGGDADRSHGRGQEDAAATSVTVRARWLRQCRTLGVL